ncbi:glycosyltransferase family 4 protein [Peribacillus sp. ACCC06369]|uniref:glycosyltransferase family 4 protein n=1 Tax=Peribacillus sp. ACCC06369 TaxID=3055860 RepID=UPI0025A1C62C|nr:glycosyltransferase family 4 protein [Peribacillus sp. ACCC06369]MDM5359871.1 glycosyltransferase family 4 protein [Peribacillus sp. ACCC06369]
MKKYLFISNSTKPTKDQQISREKVKLTNVSLPCIEAVMNMGYEVYMGVNRSNAEELDCEYDINFYNSSTYRSLTDIKSNFTAFRNLMTLLKREKIQVIHCNTPIGGLVGRICGKLAKVPKVIYTAHGFHFYEGASFINRTVIKFAELWMARYTDVIITMNLEDYKAAQKFKLRNGGKVYYVPGVGVDTKNYQLEYDNNESLRRSLGLREDDIILISMGDLVDRKNYTASINAVAKSKNQKLHFLICGRGPELDSLQKLAKRLGVERNIHFLGFRTDIKELLSVSDIFLLTSYQEGLPRSMMEAMATGLPCVASKVRGNTDLIEASKGGYLCNPDDIDGLAECISKLALNEQLRGEMGLANLTSIREYDVENVKKIISDIYLKELSNVKD